MTHSFPTRRSSYLEDQEGEQHRDREDVGGGVAVGLFLIREVGPLECHALWQFGARDPFHCCNRLPRAEARRGAAANIGRWKAVIVDDAVRSGARRGGNQSREREDRKSTRLNSSH